MDELDASMYYNLAMASDMLLVGLRPVPPPMPGCAVLPHPALSGFDPSAVLLGPLAVAHFDCALLVEAEVPRFLKMHQWAMGAVWYSLPAFLPPHPLSLSLFPSLTTADLAPAPAPVSLPRGSDGTAGMRACQPHEESGGLACLA